MSAATAAWLGWMAPMTSQLLVLGALVLLADTLLARLRAWAQLRHALWLAVFAKMLLPPWLGSPVGLLAIGSPAASGGALPGGASGGALGAGGTLSSAGSLVSAGSTASALPIALSAGWALGVAVILGMSWRRSAARRRSLLAEARPAPGPVERSARRASRRLGLRRTPRILLSPAAAGPLVCGLLRPVVVLPLAAAEPEAARRLEPVLLHELAHVRRGDLVAAAAVSLLRALHWFHPVAWLAARRVADLRELCCDASVAAVLRERTPEYRDALLDEARRLLAPTGGPATGLGWRGGGAGLLGRLAALEGAPWRHAALRRTSCAAASFLLAACVLPMGAGAAAKPGTHAAAPDPELALAVRTLEAGVAPGGPPGCLPMRAAAMRILAARRERP